MSTILNIKDAQGNWHPVPYANGVTYTPSVDTEGVISWTNDGGKENPTPRNIKGADAVINGENTLTISAGENIEIEQEGSEMSIKVKNSKEITSESTDDTVPTSKTVYDFQDTAIDAIESILPIGTSTGDIDDAKSYKMMGVTAEGKYEQETTEGKQLFDIDNIYGAWTSQYSHCRYSIQDKSIITNIIYTETETSTSSYFFAIARVRDIFNKQVTFSCDYKSSATNKGGVRILTFNDITSGTSQSQSSTSNISPDVLGQSTSGHVEYTFTITDENLIDDYVVIRLYAETWNSLREGDYTTFSNIMLNDGSTATPYEPYTGGIPSPNPDYPQEITQVSSATLKRCGKNLAYDGWAEDFVSRVNNESKVKFETRDGRNCVYWVANVGSDYDKIYMFKTNWKENTQYMIKFDVYTGNSGDFKFNMAVEYADGTKNSLSTTSANSWNSFTFTSSINKTIKYIRTSQNAAYTSIDLDTFMIKELSEGDDTYKPYQGQTIPINLNGNTINAVSDTIHDNLLIDKKGNAAIERNANGQNISITEIITLSNNNKAAKVLDEIGKVYTTSDTALCNRATFTPRTSPILFQNGTFYSNPANFVVVGSADDTLETMQNKYNGSIIYYQLATSTIIPLPKLSVLPTTLEGINHIWVDTNIGRLNIEVKYVEDLQKRIQELSTALVAIGGEV